MWWHFLLIMVYNIEINAVIPYTLPTSKNRNYGLYYPKRDIQFCNKFCSRWTETIQHVACECNYQYIKSRNCLLYLERRYITARKIILQKFNYLRYLEAAGSNEKVCSDIVTVANMNVINYSTDLEYVAQCTANKCREEIDACLSTKRHPYVLQLVFVLQTESQISERTVIEKALYKWVSKDKDWENIDCVNDSAKVIHTHPPWYILFKASATHVGCVMKYRYDMLPETVLRIYYVCNVAFLTNPWEDDELYKGGAPCSKCMNNKICNKDFPGLCGDILPVPIVYPIIFASAERLSSSFQILTVSIFNVLIVLIFK